MHKLSEIIKEKLKKNQPILTSSQKQRMFTIINSNNPHFEKYGIKMNNLEEIVREIFNENEYSYIDALKCFRELIKSVNEDEQFAVIFFLSFYKSFFTKNTIEEFYIGLRNNCSTWCI